MEPATTASLQSENIKKKKNKLIRVNSSVVFANHDHLAMVEDTDLVINYASSVRHKQKYTKKAAVVTQIITYTFKVAKLERLFLCAK